MTPEEFRRHGVALVDWIASYLSQNDQYPVLSPVRPGDIRDRLPSSPPESGTRFLTKCLQLPQNLTSTPVASEQPLVQASLGYRQ